jgi:hypothetical protein
LKKEHESFVSELVEENKRREREFAGMIKSDIKRA